jgi:hypothetical protein
MLLRNATTNKNVQSKLVLPSRQFLQRLGIAIKAGKDGQIANSFKQVANKRY